MLRAHCRTKQSFEILVILEKVDTTTPFGTPALVDSGASGNFIDLDYAQSRGFKINKLPRSISLYNIDGTLNSQGAVKYTVSTILKVHGHSERILLYATNLGDLPIVLGLPWLSHHNPEVD